MVLGMVALAKDEVLRLMRSSRAEWLATLARVPVGRMIEPGVVGDWSVKDIVAHVAWSDREIALVFRDHHLRGSPLWELPLPERNSAMVAAAREEPLEVVLADAERCYEELLAAIEACNEADLADSSRFREMPAEWEPWMLLRGTSWGHYPDHIADIRAWLDVIVRSA
ncbi:MAG: maleylpyruvate isomerase N-terminal domain-containing protein [Dehalococcoidia bacterium]